MKTLIPERVLRYSCELCPELHVSCLQMYLGSAFQPFRLSHMCIKKQL